MECGWVTLRFISRPPTAKHCFAGAGIEEQTAEVRPASGLVQGRKWQAPAV